MSTLTKTTDETAITRIKPSGGWSLLNLRDLWHFRELIYFLTWRDLKVRYKQTLLGAAWALLKPFMTMVVFSIFFGMLAKVDSDGIPYPIFVYTALLPWQFFENALAIGGHSLVQNRHMITKIYFPRIILPMSSVLAGLVDLAIAFLILIGMMFFYGYPLRLEMLALPVFIIITIITAMGAALWFSALNVLYRDFNYITGFVVQFWLFITPVVYTSSLLPEQYRLLYALNPMTGVVEGFRWALLGNNQTDPFGLLAVSIPMAIVLFVSGLFYFRRMERQFADMV